MQSAFFMLTLMLKLEINKINAFDYNFLLMLKVSSSQFSTIEEKIAQQALQKAHQREVSALISQVRDRAKTVTELEDLWYLHDLLSTKRYEIDGKYAWNDSTFVFDFARLVQEGWLTLDDLEGLSSEIRSKISVLSRM